MPKVRLGVLQEGRCIDEFDGRAKVSQATLGRVRAVGQHASAVDPGERLVVRVLEQARGADRQGVTDAIRQRSQVAHDRRRQLRPQKRGVDLSVRHVRQGKRPQIVLREESVEDLGAEDDGGRDKDANPLRPLGPAREEAIDEPETAPLAPHGTAADPREATEVLQIRAREIDDHAATRVRPQPLKHFQKVGPQPLRIRKLGDAQRSHLGRELELRPRHAPVGKVVSGGMEDQ